MGDVGGQWVGELACWAAHPGASLRRKRLASSSSSAMVVVGGLWFRHAAVVFTPTSLERGGVRWSQVALADLGDVALASSLGVGNGWWWWWEEEAVWQRLVFPHLATINIVGKIWLGHVTQSPKFSLSPNSGHIICHIYVFCAPHIFSVF